MTNNSKDSRMRGSPHATSGLLDLSRSINPSLLRLLKSTEHDKKMTCLDCPNTALKDGLCFAHWHATYDTIDTMLAKKLREGANHADQ